MDYVIPYGVNVWLIVTGIVSDAQVAVIGG